MPSCPPLEQWQLMLAERLADSDLATLAEHLDGCVACRQTLDRLTTDAESERWRQLRKAGTNPRHEPPAPFLRRLQDDTSLPPPPVLSLSRTPLAPVSAEGDGA